MKDLRQFIGKYKVEKTLRFELRPVGKTEAWLDLTNDKTRAVNYATVKKLIDRYHKVCIRESLTCCDFIWTQLAEAINTHLRSKTVDSQKALRKCQDESRSQIAKKFPSFRKFAELTAPTPNTLIKDILPNCVRDKKLPEFYEIDNVDDAIRAMSLFEGFALYFDSYQKNRKNLYTAENIASSVAHRIVHDNFPKFLANIKVYENIRVICPEVIETCKTELEQYLKGKALDEVFCIGYFNNVLTQDGIDLYNTIIGGVSGKEGEKKCQGINELVNQFLQTDNQGKGKKKAQTMMVPLFKQILSDKSTYSYIPEKIKDEDELISVIKDFHAHITDFYLNGKTVNIVEELQRMAENLDDFDPRGLFVEGKKLNTISNRLFGDIYELRFRMTSHLKMQGWTKANIEKFMKRDTFSVAELCLDKKHSLTKYFADLKKNVKDIGRHWEQFEKRNENTKQKKYKDNNTGIELLRHLLDDYKVFLANCSLLNVDSENNLDSNFYSSYIPLITELQSIIPLYNQARNFLSQKPSDDGKYLLKFDNVKCAIGWDEPQKKSVLIFRRQGKYQIGVVDSNNRSCLNNLDEIAPNSAEDQIDFLDYNQGGHMGQNLLTLVVKDDKTVMVKGHKEGDENPELEQQLKELLPPDIYRIRKSQSYKNDSPNFSKDDLTLFIDYYKQRAKEYYSHFSFSFKESYDYESFTELVEDINTKAYRIIFVPTSYKHLQSLVDEGKLYLFDIKNKDYEPGAHGKKNLHTLYWEQLFSEENLENLVIKLNAKSKLFCRPQVITNPKSHKKGSMLLNRKDKDGKPIPERIYQQLYKYVNGKISKDKLDSEAKAYLDKITAKEAQFTITKDRRYTKQKYFIHISTTLNANVSKAIDINKEVKEYITANPNVTIIGIDRGERNLLCLSLINQRGEILDQKSLNVINGFDYHAKLEQREKERDEAQRSWQSVGNITDLKEGYLSAAIHEITTMMIENNAIIVLEDLNRGFKRGRLKFEKQVYQLFEKKLIEKLNYLCSKDYEPTVDGGILRGYQLTEKFVSFEKMNKQNGFLFYVRPDYTSAIDPVTGFVSHFNFSEIHNTKDRKDFLEKMESITFTNGHVVFVFDYRKFKPKNRDYKNVWTVSSSGRRIIWDNENKQNIDYYPTTAILEAFAAKGITLGEGTNIKALLSKMDSSTVNAEFYRNLFEAFRRTVQLRNSNSETGDDYILSPAVDNGKQYSSAEELKRWKEAGGKNAHQLPIDADANGAYHIALKGLYMLINPQAKTIENEKWFKFVVEKQFKGEKTT